MIKKTKSGQWVVATRADRACTIGSTVDDSDRSWICSSVNADSDADDEPIIGKWIVASHGSAFEDAAATGSKGMRSRIYNYLEPMDDAAKAFAATPVVGSERKIAVVREAKTEMVGATIRIGKDSVPHLTTRVIKCERFSDGLARGMRIDDGFRYELSARKMSDLEAAEFEQREQIAKLEKDLRYYSGPIDDDRMAAYHATEVAIREELATLKAAAGS